MYKITTATSKDIKFALKTWKKQFKYVNSVEAKASYNLLKNTELAQTKVIKLGKAILGIISYEYNKRSKSIYIRLIASSPNIVEKRTFKGVGTCLIKSIINYAKRIHARKITLTSVRDWFFRKLGFIKQKEMFVLNLESRCYA